MTWKTAEGWRKAHVPHGDFRWSYAYCWVAPVDMVGWVEPPADMPKCKKCLKLLAKESEVKP